MNYLAHIYLSGDNELITIGNFTADAIKGNKYKNYPKELQIGILLHRHIDSFTDAHKTVRLSTKRLHKNYGHYAGVIVDIFYDHFLAKNWSNYSNIPLKDYVENFYNSLEANFETLPQKVKHMVPYMINGNWLLSYADIDGIQKVLDGMNRRTKNKSKMNMAINELQEYYNEFESEFTSFFKELIDTSNKKLQELNKTFL
ncbi:acyl carrier protein phosphodiesterase [Seonamhaeicola aphaedonensis]|uniref:Acyl carrier protein phosphodiesterase n=1 Tax=Seonamhaeicola aphaedonensis TaxID=1461338 RepID=A0A3D9HIH7_9FLAO|nr:acyl carrier protein phosphodiesterase [Seonamhaeicola aphaedonensis]RED49290.1 acyl carrier protein phosphodiesterase [Seonamhaeicola aphaedonensis]